MMGDMAFKKGGGGGLSKVSLLFVSCHERYVSACKRSMHVF